MLTYSWTRILLTTTVDKKVSVRSISKTFASGKTEKLVYQTLAELGLPSDKVRIGGAWICIVYYVILIFSEWIHGEDRLYL